MIKDIQNTLNKQVKEKGKYCNKVTLTFSVFLIIDVIMVLISCISHIISISVALDFVPWSGIFLTIIAFITFVGLFYFAIDSILKENKYELVGFLIVSLLLRLRMLWTLVGTFGNIANKEFTVTYKVCAFIFIIIPSLLQICCQITYFVLAYPIIKKFGWLLYDQCGVDRKVVNSFRIYQSFVVGMRVEYLLAFIIVPILLFYIDYGWRISYITLSCYSALCVCLYYFILYYVVKQEASVLMWIYFAFNFIGPIYYFAKLLDIWFNPEKVLRNPRSVGSTFTYKEVNGLISVTLILAVIWKIVLNVLVSMMVLQGFNNGLLMITNKRINKQIHRKSIALHKNASMHFDDPAAFGKQVSFANVSKMIAKHDEKMTKESKI